MSVRMPGPWFVAGRCIEGPDGNIALLNLARNSEVTRATAHLIAAAPDQNSALIHSTQLLRNIVEIIDPDEPGGMETLDALRGQIAENEAAIAKAEGHS